MHLIATKAVLFSVCQALSYSTHRHCPPFFNTVNNSSTTEAEQTQTLGTVFILEFRVQGPICKLCHTRGMSLASFPDSILQLFIACLHSAIKSWGVESGNEASMSLLETSSFRQDFITAHCFILNMYPQFQPEQLSRNIIKLNTTSQPRISLQQCTLFVTVGNNTTAKMNCDNHMGSHAYVIWELLCQKVT